MRDGQLDAAGGERLAARDRQLVAGERAGIAHRQIEQADLEGDERDDPQHHDQGKAELALAGRLVRML
jgi:hypothetical protein